ncbi:hypothetical protein [Massilia sp. GCM10023247]|uniref:hypothetical protein n=1 Tax=Massilia sp. GCM10023247 TaxID=3252643 RepID=UPI0036174995
MSTKNITRALLALGGLLALAGLTGCATVVQGEYQVVSVGTRTPAGAVSGVTCQLMNKKGIHYVTTPGTLSVYRDASDMRVTCDKPGLPTTTTIFKARPKPLVAGNILLPIGVLVDHVTGAGYGYPAAMEVAMTGEVTDATTTGQQQPWWRRWSGRESK